MADSKKKNTVAVVEELAAPIAESLGLRIWDVRYLKEGSQWYLRIFIDKDGGVDINDCEKMSRAIDEPLDKADPIEGEYIKDFKGVLTGYDDGEVTITDHSGENTVTINKKDAAYIKLDDFD